MSSKNRSRNSPVLRQPLWVLLLLVAVLACVVHHLRLINSLRRQPASLPLFRAVKGTKGFPLLSRGLPGNVAQSAQPRNTSMLRLRPKWCPQLALDGSEAALTTSGSTTKISKRLPEWSSHTVGETRVQPIRASVATSAPIGPRTVLQRCVFRHAALVGDGLGEGAQQHSMRNKTIKKSLQIQTDWLTGRWL